MNITPEKMQETYEAVKEILAHISNNKNLIRFARGNQKISTSLYFFEKLLIFIAALDLTKDCSKCAHLGKMRICKRCLRHGTNKDLFRERKKHIKPALNYRHSGEAVARVESITEKDGELEIIAAPMPIAAQVAHARCWASCTICGIHGYVGREITQHTDENGYKSLLCHPCHIKIHTKAEE